jgi:hypothetical protein
MTDHIETTLPCLTFTASIPGDMSALGILTVDNDAGAGADWWGVTWGVQSRNYNSSANAALFYEAEGRTAMGGSATNAGPAGASGSSVMRNTALATSSQAILSTQATGGGPHLSHIGSFQVWARVQVPTSNLGAVSIAWEWGDRDFRRSSRNAERTLSAEMEGSWRRVDLGLVTLTKAVAGVQRWEGRLLARSTRGGDDIDVDWIMLVPADEGSGTAVALLRASTPTVFAARDEFDQSAGALTGKTPPVSTGNWAGAGDTDDFTIDAAAHTAVRTAVSDAGTLALGRFAIAGTGTLTNAAVAVTATTTSGASVALRQGVLARYTDTANFLLAEVVRADGGVHVYRVVAGVETLLGQREIAGYAGPGTVTLRLVATAAGHWGVWVNGRLVMVDSDPVLATGGTLASGRVGFFDQNLSAGAATRTYDDFAAWAPVSDAAAFAAQSIEIRHDGIVREDSGGTLWQPTSSYTGGFLTVPPAGAEGRTARIIVSPLYGPPTAGVYPDGRIDDLSAVLSVIPRYLT